MAKRKKVEKMRGKKRHGYGGKKRHRGAGSRGGRGMAGSGKRADQKKPSILKEYGTEYFGKRGFKRPQKMIKKIKTINLSELNKFKGDEIDLKGIGYNKLLGKGNINKKLKVIVKYASKKAVERIKKHGGEVILDKKHVNSK